MRSEHWSAPPDGLRHAPAALDADWVLASGPVAAMADPATFEAVRAHYPGAHIVGASSGGEITGRAIRDGGMAVTAVSFEHTETVLVTERVHGPQSSYAHGQALGAKLRAERPGEAPAHVLLLADLGPVCGDALARGLSDALPDTTTVTGGHAALPPGAPRSVVWADGIQEWLSAAALAFYGDRLHVGCGAVGGWTAFGPDRLITRADGDTIFTLDDQPALALYKRYLGPLAEQLPDSALFFPLAIRQDHDDDIEVVRSALGIDEQAQSLRFAGRVTEGSMARLMRTNPDRVVDGAAQAAQWARQRLGRPADLALVLSCFGRRGVLGARAEEEVDAVAEELGDTPIAGFYAFGEFAPTASAPTAVLHNQTMTVTAFAEA